MATISAIGKYTVLGTLGKGAHSTIFHVRRAEDSREYALKIVTIADEEQQKFLDQAEHELLVAKKLNHVNLVKVYCLEKKRNLFFQVRKALLLIEFINGSTLDSNPIPLDKFPGIFYRIGAGLAHMHKQGIFHADLKPNNIMLGRRGEVKIIDYGLAWIKGVAKDRVQGTPEYMAPETAKSRIVNERSDMYNFGATMYRIATLKLPPCVVPVGDSIRINAKAYNDMLAPVRELNKAVPKPLADLIHRCIEFDPEKRPRWMGEVLAELKLCAKAVGEMIEEDEE